MSDTFKVNNCPKCGGPIPREAPQGLCPKCLLLQASLPTETGKGANTKSLPPPREELAAAFPQLEVLELIGQGGMGFVYKARQPKIDRLVALKILPQSLAADPAFAERFTREGRLLARLNHPNIVTIHDFGQANGYFYLLMEFVDGVNLRQAMQVGRFTPEQALKIVPKICEALEFAHHEGILHRDIKPENILLDPKGRVKIADFGIAKLMGEVETKDSLTGQGALLGTPHYMAPEQLEKPNQVDHRADIYSLGVVFYEMLTGELPLGKFQPPSQKSTADQRLDDVVLRALEKEPNRRTQSAGEVKTQVETIATNPPIGSGSGFAQKPKAPIGEKTSKPALRGLSALFIFNTLTFLALTICFWAKGNLPVSLLFLLSSVMSAIVAVTFLRRAQDGSKITNERQTMPGNPPDRFWKRFALIAAFLVVAVVSIPIIALLLAIAIPAFQRSRAQKDALATQVALPATKTIVLTRGATRLFSETNAVRNLTVWTDTPLLAGESIVARVKNPDGTLSEPGFNLFTSCVGTKVRTSCALGWLFPDPFSNDNAETVLAYLQATRLDRPVTLKAGQLLEIFSITNKYEGVMTGYIEFIMTKPKPLAPGAKVQASVKINEITGYFPSITYTPIVPPGYILRATASVGEAHTQVYSESQEYRTTWFRPQTSNPSGKNWAIDRQAQQWAIEAQLRSLQQEGRFDVVFGEPRLLFSVTNAPGDVFQTFLELVGPSRASSLPVALPEESAPFSAPPATRTTTESHSNKEANPLRVSSALSFDGVDDYVSVNLNSPTNTLTLEAQVRFTGKAFTTFHTIMEFGNDAPWLGVYGDGALRLWDTISGGSMPIGEWTHVAYSWDGTNSRLFVNGQITAVNTTSPPRSGEGLGIGHNYSDQFWQGEIDEVRIWNVARTPDEIARNHHGSLEGTETGLIGYYRFEETDGTVAFDSAPAGGINDGGLHGSPLRVARQMIPATSPNLASNSESESQLVIDNMPVFPADGLPQTGRPYWGFTCLVPPQHQAQFLFVRWTNDIPTIIDYYSTYVKVSKTPAELKMTLSYTTNTNVPATNKWAAQWNVNLGLGRTVSDGAAAEPKYQLFQAPHRTRVRSSHQGSIRLVNFVQPEGRATTGRNGIELRILVEPLKTRAIRTVPTEIERENYIGGSGLIGTIEEALAEIKNRPLDP